MNEVKTLSCSYNCPPTCPGTALLDIAASIAHQEDALACIINAECAKINRVVSISDNLENLLAIDDSARAMLEQVTTLEGVLKAKLDSILPFLND